MRLWREKRRSKARRDGHSARLAEVQRLEDAWGVESCAGCGRTVVLGEPLRHVRMNGAQVAVCSDCYKTITRRQDLPRAA